VSFKKIKFNDKELEVVDFNQNTRLLSSYSLDADLINFLESNHKKIYGKSILQRYKTTDDSILNNFGNFSPESADMAAFSSGHLSSSGMKVPISKEIKNFLSYIVPYSNLEDKVGISLYYPPNGGYMGWHTNCKHRNNSIQAFFTKGSGYFQYLEDGVVYRIYDSEQWKCNVFIIGDCSNPTWHSIWGGPEGRYSIGFKDIG
jgi:hypothetical protein